MSDMQIKFPSDEQIPLYLRTQGELFRREGCEVLAVRHERMATYVEGLQREMFGLMGVSMALQDLTARLDQTTKELTKMHGLLDAMTKKFPELQTAVDEGSDTQ